MPKEQRVAATEPAQEMTDAPAAALKLREGFAWQCRLVKALQGYAEKAADAFEALAFVHEVLDEGGIAKVLDAAPLAHDLLRGFREAGAAARGAAGASRELLETHRASLDACAGLLREADAADAALKAASAGGPAVLARNSEKVQKATTRAAMARDSANNALQACAGRKRNLCQLAVGSVAAVAKAVRYAAAAVSTESTPSKLCSKQSTKRLISRQPSDNLTAPSRQHLGVSQIADQGPGRDTGSGIGQSISPAAPDQFCEEGGRDRRDTEAGGGSPPALSLIELDLDLLSNEGPAQCKVSRSYSDFSSSTATGGAFSLTRLRGYSSENSWGSTCWSSGGLLAALAPSKDRALRS